MKQDKNFGRRVSVTMMIVCGFCLTGLSMIMAVGSERL
jgi:hypothetical protein